MSQYNLFNITKDLSNPEQSFPATTNMLPRHGENVLSNVYAPPIFIYVPFGVSLPVLVPVTDTNYTIAFTDDRKKYVSGATTTGTVTNKYLFVTNSPTHNILEFLEDQFVYQYGVTPISKNNGKIIYSLQSKEYETYVIVQNESNKIPNFQFHNEVYGVFNYCKKTLLTYRVDETIYAPYGNFDSDAGFYFTIDSTYDISYSTIEFYIPASGYLIDETQITTINKNSKYCDDYIPQNIITFSSPYSDIFLYKPNNTTQTLLFKNLVSPQASIFSSYFYTSDNMQYYINNALINDTVINYFIEGGIFIAINENIVYLENGKEIIIDSNNYLFDGNIVTKNNVDMGITFDRVEFQILFPDMYSSNISRSISPLSNVEYLEKTFFGINAKYIENRIVRPEEDRLISYLRTEDEKIFLNTCFIERDSVYYRFGQLDDVIFASLDFAIMAKKVFVYPRGSIKIDIGDKINDGEYTNVMGNIFTILNSSIPIDAFPFEYQNYRFEARESDYEVVRSIKVVVDPLEFENRANAIDITAVLFEENVDYDIVVLNRIITIKNITVSDKNLFAKLVVQTKDVGYHFETNTD